MNTAISALRRDLSNMINSAILYNEPITVTTKNGNVVIISEEEYNGLIATSQIMENGRLYEKVLRGKEESLDFCCSENE